MASWSRLHVDLHTNPPECGAPDAGNKTAVPRSTGERNKTTCSGWQCLQWRKLLGITMASWWLNQPVWRKMRPSNWFISPGIGVNIKNIRNHHLACVVAIVVGPYKNPRLDPPMEGWMNLSFAVVFLGPQNDAIFEGEIRFFGLFNCRELVARQTGSKQNVSTNASWAMKKEPACIGNIYRELCYPVI